MGVAHSVSAPCSRSHREAWAGMLGGAGTLWSGGPALVYWSVPIVQTIFDNVSVVWVVYCTVRMSPATNAAVCAASVQPFVVPIVQVTAVAEFVL